MDIEENAEVFECLKNPESHQFIQYANAMYLPWSEFMYKKMPGRYAPEIMWAATKFVRSLNLQTVSFSDPPILEFSFNQNEEILRQLHEFDMNIGGNMSGESIIPTDDKDRYLVSSIMEEAIASSQLEGAVTTREVAKEMLRQQRRPKDKSEQMIVNNYLTIQKILEWKGRKITQDALLELHGIVTNGTLEDSSFAGKFRDNDKIKVFDGQSGEVLHVPPSHKNLPELMDSFFQFANEKHPHRFIHPIIKASLLHFLIGYIHPFVDGNGRTARALFYWYLIKHGYWLLEYMSISRMIKRAPIQYAKAYLYTEHDDNDTTYFIKYTLRTMGLAFDSLKSYINRKIQEKQQLFDFDTIDGINSRQVQILKLLSDKPRKRLTIKEIETTFAVVYQTARTDLLGLHEMGLLSKKTEGKKKMIFFRHKDFRKRLSKIREN